MKNKITLSAVLGATLVALPALSGDIAGTSFEEPPVFTVQYVDTGDAGTDHQLFNNADQPFVEYATQGGELGFTAFYFNTRNDVGLTEGDFVGVTDFVGTVGAYTDGLQGYQMSDADGAMRLVVNAVDLSGSTAPEVSFDYFVQETGWEADDRVHIWLTTDIGDFTVINTAGSDIDDLAIEGFWIPVAVDLTGASTATLHFEIECNAGPEAIFIDNIRFVEKGTTGETDVCPDSFSRPRGIDLGGTVASLCDSDDDRVLSRPDVFVASIVPPVQVIAVGTSPNLNPTELRYTFEGSVGNAPILQRISFFNFDTNAYQLMDSRVASLSDSQVLLSVTSDPGRFVSDTGEMRTLVAYTQIGTFPPTWQARQDQMMWTVVD